VKRGFVDPPPGVGRAMSCARACVRDVSVCRTCHEMDGRRCTLTNAHMHAKAQVRIEQTHRKIAIAPEALEFECTASLAWSKVLT
jgi:hypothetical protein